MNNNKDIIGDLKSVLVDSLPDIIENVILFGSRVAGKQKKYSDYDVLIITKKKGDWKLRKKISSLCYDMDLKYDILIDAKIFSHNELNSIKGKQPYVLQALGNGMVA